MLAIFIMFSTVACHHPPRLADLPHLHKGKVGHGHHKGKGNGDDKHHDHSQ